MKFDERKEPIIQGETINPFRSITEAFEALEQMTEEERAELFAELERVSEQ